MAKYALSTFLLVINVLFHEELTSYAATCSFNNLDCQRGTVCCGVNCSENCIGESCTHDIECGGSNEFCGVNKKCFAGCHSNFGCRNGKVCCPTVHKCKENCLGEPCGTSDDCGSSSEYCPTNAKECRIYKSDSKTFPVWLIVVLVIAILIVVLPICWGIRVICRYGLSANAGENYTTTYCSYVGGGGGGGGC